MSCKNERIDLCDRWRGRCASATGYIRDAGVVSINVNESQLNFRVYA